MSATRIFIAGIGVVSPVACGVAENWAALIAGKKAIAPITIFPPAHGTGLPVGEVRTHWADPNVPRTHNLALIAAREALAGSLTPPDAVVMGGTTGGMLETEEVFKAGEPAGTSFRYHSQSSVAEYLAAELRCPGPVITVSTACSSGAVAIKIAVEMLRAAQAKRILVGGADGLCRLTYYGFRSLQLIDPAGARPLDTDRHGMTLAEGAGMLLLEAKDETEGNTACEILGAGLSCDAYHPSSPDPHGKGALNAMKAALEDAGVPPSEVDYISVHGTGTVENDFTEARAIRALFEERPPPLSSIKGSMGHSLAASGAIEAGIAAMSIKEGLMPGTTGCARPDPHLGLNPLIQPLEGHVNTVLSNAFGFGGNNASVVIGRRGATPPPVLSQSRPCLAVMGSACITGAGDIIRTIRAVSKKGDCRGVLQEKAFSLHLPPRSIRRFKRLSRMVLSLAVSAHKDSGIADDPASVFFCTGWGPLSEAYGFLDRLRSSEEAFSSPISFVGSVHNAPAGHVAMHFRATGPNITTSSGDYSFEQALMTAGLVLRETHAPALVVGADEFHGKLSRSFDRSVAGCEIPADGGGALCVMRSPSPSGTKMAALFFENTRHNPSVMASLVRSLGGVKRIHAAYGALLAGIPGAYADLGREQLEAFCSSVHFQGPVIHYRRFTGEFASASAVAAVLGVALVRDGAIPAGFVDSGNFDLKGKGILMLGFGKFITAVEILETPDK